MANRPRLWLSLCVAAALLPRLLTNVILRPEFVGWFNHSTYYWVQTRSLLNEGRLAYEDMPGLFEIYAVLTAAIAWTGVSIDTATVFTSRLAMAVVPALIPLATYRLAQTANAGRELGFATWCGIFASGFLPLTYAHMPETLQKNMLGILLLALAIAALLAWIRSKNVAKLAVLMVITIAIMAVHLGSSLAMLLLLAAVAADRILSVGMPRQTLQSLLVIAASTLVLMFMVGTYYPGATRRITTVFQAFLPDAGLQAFAMLFQLTMWLGITAFVWRWSRKKTGRWDAAVASLVRICLLWVCLLVLPFWPGEIGMRLMLFIPLAGITLVLLLLSQSARRWPRVAAVGAAIVCLSMSIGEAVSQAMIYPDKERIAQELNALQEQFQLRRTDLIITPYGVGPTANWFLGTKAALITAVDHDIFLKHDRVFVLNTLERSAPTPKAGSCTLVTTEIDRYLTTRHDIPLEGVDANPAFAYFSIYKLDSLPANWHFDAAGRWSGWGNCEEIGRGERI